jgi:hypothetical protein
VIWYIFFHWLLKREVDFAAAIRGDDGSDDTAEEADLLACCVCFGHRYGIDEFQRQALCVLEAAARWKVSAVLVQLAWGKKTSADHPLRALLLKRAMTNLGRREIDVSDIETLAARVPDFLEHFKRVLKESPEPLSTNLCARIIYSTGEDHALREIVVARILEDCQAGKLILTHADIERLYGREFLDHVMRFRRTEELERARKSWEAERITLPATGAKVSVGSAERRISQMSGDRLSQAVEGAATRTAAKTWSRTADPRDVRRWGPGRAEDLYPNAASGKPKKEYEDRDQEGHSRFWNGN